MRIPPGRGRREPTVRGRRGKDAATGALAPAQAPLYARVICNEQPGCRFGRAIMKLRWCGLALLPLCVAPSANATVALTGVGLRVGDHPAYVRVVVTFTDGDLRAFEASALDPSPFNGAAL